MYTRSIGENKIVLLRRLFKSLNKDPMIMMSSGDTFASLEQIENVDSELLTLVVCQGKKISGIRKFVKDIFLNFERVRTTRNKENITIGYEFVDKKGIWAAIK